MPERAEVLDACHDLSVVIPVYQGEDHLGPLIDELAPYTEPFTTPGGATAKIGEVLLVDDNGPDDSPSVMRVLAAEHSWVRVVWLSRNFGQHAATLAGMSSTGGDWIVTMDEDGQQDPADIGGMLDTALREQATVVYGQPINQAPHGALRNSASRAAKWLIAKVGGTPEVTKYNSFRLVLGEVGRSVAAYAGAGIYLDVALGWVARPAVTSPVTLRDEGDRVSGYRFRSLLSHFWRMTVTSGTRALRLVSVLGALLAALGVTVAIVLVIAKLAGSDVQAGWTSLITVMLLTSGAILFALGVLAEYIGAAVNMAMGRPAYLVVSDPADGPLGRTERAHEPGEAREGQSAATP
ncbi:glycosyltransferase [Mumia sp. zg.B53]|uniref:glycosyltransferase n=1 Tax=Mumia sp. zg.B53 TaxID=2855449 RepID=UPI0027E28125|nr:glycosyltransferase [Mumia sp. zg.B53]